MVDKDIDLLSRAHYAIGSLVCEATDLSSQCAWRDGILTTDTGSSASRFVLSKLKFFLPLFFFFTNMKKKGGGPKCPKGFLIPRVCQKSDF